jgi:hypothetical protein
VLTACRSRRAITIHLRGVRHVRVRRVTTYVDGRRTSTGRTSRKSVVLRLAGRPKTTVRVRFVITTTKGRRVTDRRAYRTCTPR